MRFRARVDVNHGELVAALRRMGYGVVSLASLGRGVPDLCVAIPGSPICLLMEVKRPKSGRLTKDQVEWHYEWPGRVYVVNGLPAALAAIQDVRASIDGTKCLHGGRSSEMLQATSSQGCLHEKGG